MAKATGGANAQFTYDFGISIAQSTVRKITALTGVTLSLASAFYALKSTASEYVESLRKNTFLFGGVLGTMKAIEQAQKRLIKGQSYFDIDDQLAGMNRLMAAGVSVEENLAFINKAAHASGQSFAQFSGAIANAISGNMGQLVEMGLLTQRSTRMFEKYAANTIQREKAIIDFLKTHKGLEAAIRDDFETIQDQTKRIGSTWRAFLKSVVGAPNDPMSLYGQTTGALKMVAEAFSRHYEQIQKVGSAIGQVLGWIVKNIGNAVTWMGRKVIGMAKSLDLTTDKFAEKTRALIVWFEFAKLKVVDVLKSFVDWVIDAVKTAKDFYNEHSTLIKIVAVLGAVALAWKLLGDKIMWCYAVQMRYVAFQRQGLYPAMTRTQALVQSLAVWLPRPFRGAWVWMGKFIANAREFGLVFAVFGKHAKKAQKVLSTMWTILNPFKALKALPGVFKNIMGRIVYYSMYAWHEIIKKAPGAIKAFVKSIPGAFRKALTSLWGGLKSFGSGFVRVMKSFGTAILHPIATIRKLWATVKGLFTFIRIGIKALYASNPVGWILLAITALVTLYTQCKTFRLLVNNMFKAWWEYIKLLWNILYGTFIAIAVCVKKFIWEPLKNAFFSAVDWIREMWSTFKDSSVGRFIDKWIVSPLHNLFNWIMKGIKWLLKGAASILSVINTKLADKIREGEKELGMENFSLAASGGTYDHNDDTNYLNPTNWFSGKSDDSDSKKKPATPSNPILDVASAQGYGGGGNVINNNMEYKTGAIQIIVERGEQIDENKLAQKIRYVLKDLGREQNMRGGTL